MKNIILIAIFCLAVSIFSISCGSLGGSSGVTIKAADVEKTFEPNTSIAYIDKQTDRPVLRISLANFEFAPKDKGDFLRPTVTGKPENLLIKMEILADEKADPTKPFKLGETLLAKGDDSKQRVFALNISRLVKNATQTLPVIKYKEAKITLDSVTDKEVTGSFDFQFAAKGTDGETDENAIAKGSFKAKIWKEN